MARLMQEQLVTSRRETYELGQACNECHFLINYHLTIPPRGSITGGVHGVQSKQQSRPASEETTVQEDIQKCRCAQELNLIN